MVEEAYVSYIGTQLFGLGSSVRPLAAVVVVTPCHYLNRELYDPSLDPVDLSAKVEAHPARAVLLPCCAHARSDATGAGFLRRRAPMCPLMPTTFLKSTSGVAVRSTLDVMRHMLGCFATTRQCAC